MAKALFAINAAVAWCAVALSFTLNVSGYYVSSADPSKPTILGQTPGGIDTPLERFFDWITYFTIWSNITVAIVLTVLTVRPDLFMRTDMPGFIWRTLRLDSVIMIAVTGAVFNLLLSSEKHGWGAVSNSLVHTITPILTVLVWLIAGPRRLITVKVILAMLILPVIWVVFALIRGAFVGAYPYPFLDVLTKGWASVLQFVLAIVVVAVVTGFVLLGLDKLLARLSFLPRSGTTEP
jgi:hypothetical protein